MNKQKDRKKIFRSVLEFEQKFLPKAFEKRMKEKPTDAHTLGTCLAKESLDKIRKRISE